MKKGRMLLPGLGLPGLYLLACRSCPAFARGALEGFSLPVMARLHRLTVPVPFPVAEYFALGLGAALLFTLAAALSRALARTGGRPLSRWLAGFAFTGIALGGALVLLWGPAWTLPGEPVPAPRSDPLSRLCDALIVELNASKPRFPEAEEALRLAPRVAGLPEGAVKAARYPEWMRAAGVCGLFVPLTGEALVDASAPAPLIPFTAVHELTHLTGVADEGATNIVAWKRCLSAGGPFADSARLWALRYALGLLRREDEIAWRRVSAKMEGALTRVFRECGGEIDPDQAPAPAGLRLSRGDYADLAGYLAERQANPAP